MWFELGLQLNRIQAQSVHHTCITLPQCGGDKKEGRAESQSMLNEVEELCAILKTVLLHACLKWQQRLEAQRTSHSTF